MLYPYEVIVLRHSLKPRVVIQMYSVKKLFLRISRNSQGSTCARDSFLIKLQASGLRTPENTFYRAPPVYGKIRTRKNSAIN